MAGRSGRWILGQSRIEERTHTEYSGITCTEIIRILPYFNRVLSRMNEVEGFHDWNGCIDGCIAISISNYVDVITSLRPVETVE